MNVPPASVERVQKCVVNFEIYRFLKKAANLPHPPLLMLCFLYINYLKNRDESSHTLIRVRRLSADTWAEPRASSQAELPTPADPWADPKHQVKTSEPSWALSQAKPDPDSRAKPHLSPSLDPSWAEPSIKLSPDPERNPKSGPSQ